MNDKHISVMQHAQQCGFGTLLDHPIMTERLLHFAALVGASARTRLRMQVQPLLDDWIAKYGNPTRDAYDAGRITALQQVLTIIDAEDALS